ncbi:glycine cleavage system protein GcvH [Halalkalibaculum sp. DA3122]|uniref:glycine cleavage system protein GcvH n=1 Tax=unclassified Halalkalibaculum TaxID=2964617 RepID=UPI0037547175
MDFPEELKYTREHEWIRDNGDGTATIGITDFAQSELGDIVFVELEPEGFEFEQEEVIGTVEAVKTVSELFAPVDGTIAEINASLEAEPEQVNDDPYGKGWMLKIELADASQLDALMSADEYRKIII